WDSFFRFATLTNRGSFLVGMCQFVCWRLGNSPIVALQPTKALLGHGSWDIFKAKRGWRFRSTGKLIFAANSIVVMILSKKKHLQHTYVGQTLVTTLMGLLLSVRYRPKKQNCSCGFPRTWT